MGVRATQEYGVPFDRSSRCDLGLDSFHQHRVDEGVVGREYGGVRLAIVESDGGHIQIIMGTDISLNSIAVSHQVNASWWRDRFARDTGS
jgi:hypothetical protein